MLFYGEHVLPHLIDWACGDEHIDQQRSKVVPRAEGRILEVGMGSGRNLRHYDPEKVELVWGLEPSEGMRQKARKNVARAPFEVRWLDLPGEEIPLEDESVDTVLLTYTLCTIPDWRRALEQMRRVLRPGARLLFCEHGEAPDASVRRWQERLNPLWRKIAGGCNLHRPIPRLIEEGGFRVESLEAAYLPTFPKIASFNYSGSAVAR